MSNDTKTLYPVYTRVCLRCRQSINGWGFYTLYGYILVPRADGSLERIHGCGDPVHHHCPHANARRVAPFDPEGRSLGGSRSWHIRNIERGITYNERTGRYNAFVNKKRLGSHLTIERAQQVRDSYIAQGGNNAVSEK